MVANLNEHEKTFMGRLIRDPTFQRIMTKVKDARPDLPPFATDQHGNDNAHEWRQNSLMRDGFDLCLQLIGVNHE